MIAHFAFFKYDVQPHQGRAFQVRHNFLRLNRRSDQGAWSFPLRLSNPGGNRAAADGRKKRDFISRSERRARHFREFLICAQTQPRKRETWPAQGNSCA